MSRAESKTYGTVHLDPVAQQVRQNYAISGDSFFALGRYAEAVDVYQQAIALDPEDMAARQGLEAARSRAQ